MGSGSGRSYPSETGDEYPKVAQKAFTKAEDGDIRKNSTAAMLRALVGDTNPIIQPALYVYVHLSNSCLFLTASRLVLRAFTAHETLQGLIIRRDLPKFEENYFVLEDTLGRIHNLAINCTCHWTVISPLVDRNFEQP